MSIDQYAYDLPDELIAHEPALPRDAARLLVYKTATDEVTFDTFANIAKYIPEHSLLVLNDTKVVPARLELKKKTGGSVRILFLFNEWDGGEMIKGLPDRKISIGDILSNLVEVVEAVSQINEEFTFKLHISAEEFRALCELQGKTPLPPYIHSGMDEQEVRKRYQTVFAATQSRSVAAPTASLHFTDRVFDSLKARHIDQTEVTLHVGRGTFSPVTQDVLKKGILHGEPVHISEYSARSIAQAKREGRTVVVAGTTAMRAVESAAKNLFQETRFDSVTSLFISPPYDFQIADALITNFHLPGTSLLMMVDALLRSKGAKRSWKDIYEIAIKEKFRFYSFGDAMLII